MIDWRDKLNLRRHNGRRIQSTVTRSKWINLGFVWFITCCLAKLSIAQFQLLVDAALAGWGDGHHCKVKARGQPGREAHPSDDVAFVVQANSSAVLYSSERMTWFNHQPHTTRLAHIYGHLFIFYLFSFAPMQTHIYTRTPKHYIIRFHSICEQSEQ